MFILETSVQQRVVFEEVLEALWEQKQVNLLSCKQDEYMIYKDLKKFYKMFERTDFSPI